MLYQKNFLKAATVLFGLIFAGCATGPRQITQYYLNLDSKSSSAREKDRLIVRMTPVLLSNYKSFPKINTTAQYGTKPGVYSYTETSVLVDMPAFEVIITNNTGHVVRFSRATIKLQDDAGEVYNAMMKSDLIDSLDNYAEYNAAANGKFYNTGPLKAKIRSLKIVDQNFELLPGFTEKGYLAFNFQQQSINEYKNFLGSRNYLKVLLFEIPVEMDDAGNVRKTTNFTFVYNVRAETVTVQ